MNQFQNFCTLKFIFLFINKIHCLVEERKDYYTSETDIVVIHVEDSGTNFKVRVMGDQPVKQLVSIFLCGAHTLIDLIKKTGTKGV